MIAEQATNTTMFLLTEVARQTTSSQQQHLGCTIPPSQPQNSKCTNHNQSFFFFLGPRKRKYAAGRTTVACHVVTTFFFCSPIMQSCSCPMRLTFCFQVRELNHVIRGSLNRHCSARASSKGRVSGLFSHSAIADAAALNSSLPRPFCLRNPIVLLEPGPRD